MSLFDQLKNALDANRDFTGQDERSFGLPDLDYSPAAVLVPITRRAEPGVILTQRPLWLKRHAGQVAFPGGRVDAGDADDIAAALREAEEEIGLGRQNVEVIGTAAPYYSGSGFRVTPVLGLVPPDLDYAPCPDEVDSIFEVPLSFLLDRANAALRHMEWNGAQRVFYDMQWQDRRIWGVTAGILVNLSHQLNWQGAAR